MWDAAKADLESLMTLIAYIRKEESPKSNKRNVHLPVVKQI